MSAERMPPEKATVLESLLAGLMRLVLRFPGSTLALAVAAVLIATYLSGTRLSFRTSRLDLLNPKSDFNRLWIDYINEFGDAEDVVVVLEGPDRQTIDPAVREVASRIEREPKYFHSVLHEIDRSKLRQKGLFFLDDPRKLAECEYFLDRVRPVLQGDWSMLKLGNVDPRTFAQLQQITASNPAAQAAADTELTWFTHCLLQALEGEYKSPWSDSSADAMGERPAAAVQPLVDSEKLGIVLLRLTKDPNQNDFVRHADAVNRLREIVRDVQSRYAAVKLSLTGLPIIEFDEMNSSSISMAEVSFISLIGVSILFIVGFGGWRHPLLAVISLSLGTYWSMGFISLAVGHLNILSSAFAVILIGQGIDFSMYFVAEYLQQRETIHSSGEALLNTVRRVGPGIAIGAITTSIAFFMASFTEFTGVAELGFIAGGGILLCWLAGMTVLPALIHVTDRKWPLRRMPRTIDVCGWTKPLMARPGLVLAVTLSGTAVLSIGMTRLWYDHNLLHMQARNLESVAMEKKLAAEDDLSASFAISIAGTREEVLRRKALFLQQPSVRRVVELASMFPSDAEAKRAIVARIHQRLQIVPENVPMIPVTAPENLEQVLMQMRRFVAGSQRAAQFTVDFDRIAALLKRMDRNEYYAKISGFQQRLAQDLLLKLQSVRAVSNPVPPQLADLPESLVTRYVSPKGSYLMRIYSRGDIWDMTAMEQFVSEVRKIDAHATGNPLQIFEASRQMKRSYEQAAFLAMMVILPVVYFDFRNLRHALLAVLPLGLGIAQMLGLMGMLDIPLNAANMIVLPLILGVGIDAGVHIVHDYCSQKGRYRMNASIASAVAINQVTNMAGFGSLMIASHQGLQSLGRVLTLGMGSCMFSALVILPALLTWLTWDRKEESSEAEEGDLDLSLAPEPEYELVEPFHRRDLSHPALSGMHRPTLSEYWDYPREDAEDEIPSYGGA
jgi:uncharacterized protein